MKMKVENESKYINHYYNIYDPLSRSMRMKVENESKLKTTNLFIIKINHDHN